MKNRSYSYSSDIEERIKDYKRSREKSFMLDMSLEQHSRIKKLAHDCGMSMNELFLVSVAELASKLSKKRAKGGDDV
tara:strand:- start:191 stop:421 length:231 start_codon:yes stop_codon:yes gene_type:complete